MTAPVVEKNGAGADRGKKKILFLCTHNSSRSQMAEGPLRALRGDPSFLRGHKAKISPGLSGSGAPEVASWDAKNAVVALDSRARRH